MSFYTFSFLQYDCVTHLKNSCAHFLKFTLKYFSIIIIKSYLGNLWNISMLLNQKYTKAIFKNVSLPFPSLHAAPSFPAGNHLYCFLIYLFWVNFFKEINFLFVHLSSIKDSMLHVVLCALLFSL